MTDATTTSKFTLGPHELITSHLPIQVAIVGAEKVRPDGGASSAEVDQWFTDAFAARTTVRTEGQAERKLDAEGVVDEVFGGQLEQWEAWVSGLVAWEYGRFLAVREKRERAARRKLWQERKAAVEAIPEDERTDDQSKALAAFTRALEADARETAGSSGG